jgi:iron(III) transport system substrate-binding protein
MTRRTGAAVAVALAVTLGACGSYSSTSSATAPDVTTAGTTPDGGITVYSGQHEETVTALTKAFTAKTGIAVKVRSDDEATLANQLLEEGSDSPADVFYAENPPALTVLDDSHRLGKVLSATLGAVPASQSPTSGDWVGVSARSAALAYNPTMVPESALPASLRDLADPAWKGKVGFAPSETDFQPLVTTMVKTDGLDAATTWLKGLKANAKIYDSNEDLVTAVDQGEVATGVIDHYYWYRLRDEVGADKLEAGLHYFPAGDPGALVDVSGAAVLASTKHPGSAQAFLAFLVSPEAQNIIGTSESYEYPLATGITSSKSLRPLADSGTSPMTIAQLGDGKQALALMQQVGLL